MPNSLTQVVDAFDQSGFAGFTEKFDSGVLWPDLLTSAQFYSAPSPSPYHRLLLAVLEDAIRCFQRNRGAARGQRRALFREAKEWLFDQDSTAFMSCRTVCECLGIEPTLLRRYLRQWQIRTMYGSRSATLTNRGQSPKALLRMF
jgi:hypothetical protein